MTYAPDADAADWTVRADLTDRLFAMTERFSDGPLSATSEATTEAGDQKGPRLMTLLKQGLTVFLLGMTAGATSAFAAAHAMPPSIEAMDQDVSNGVVSAAMIVAPETGWMVVHRTDAEMKPGPVVGYAPLREGENVDVAAILQEAVAPGDMLMLMVHSEAGGVTPGVFEYTLGAVEDGPIRVEDALVMQVVTAK